MKNSRFVVGDIVVKKKTVNYHFSGKAEHNFLESFPYVITSIYIDKYIDDRVGERGNSNRCSCKPLILQEHLKDNIEFIEYELTFWNERKDDIISAYETLVEDLKEIE
jgi:hypothetical protein